VVVDSNAFLGEWPFRKLPHTTADGFLRLMDKLGVDKAAVSSLHAVFYKDCAVANRLLHEQVRGHADRLIPVGTVNPSFPAWEDDLKECVEALGARAIKLFPAYHNYGFKDAALLDALDRIADARLPVILSVMLEDPRVHHWLLKVPRPEVADVAEPLKARPNAKIILASATSLVATSVAKLAPESKFCVETSKVEGPVKCVELLVRELGAQRVLLGTAAPLMNPAGALNAATQPGLSDAERQAVLGGNALAMFSP